MRRMFSICASMHAWLRIDESNVVLLVGHRLRTSMVIACYLRFIKAVDSVHDGFNSYCNKLNAGLFSPRNLPVNNLPPSVQTFFINFNNLVETERRPNASPLFLKNILVEGVPVEELPCMDLYDEKGIIYCSHVGNEDQHIWAPEDGQGLYKVEIGVSGDFYLACRFGGEHAYDCQSSRNYLFRYSNSTRFLAVGEIGIEVDRIDVREYRQQFIEEEFR